MALFKIKLFGKEINTNEGSDGNRFRSTEKVEVMAIAESSVDGDHKKEDRWVVLCPRCNSPNTKFCYFNNYNVNQPRYFCKNCRRYWTVGGALRDVPEGSGCRKKTKRASLLASQKADLTEFLVVPEVSRNSIISLSPPSLPEASKGCPCPYGYGLRGLEGHGIRPWSPIAEEALLLGKNPLREIGNSQNKQFHLDTQDLRNRRDPRDHSELHIHGSWVGGE